MEYEWEADLPDAVFDAADDALGEASIRDGSLQEFTILGIVVGHVENGEAAIIRNPNRYTDFSIWDADVWQDISGDASRFYEEAKDTMQKRFRPQ